MRNSPLLPSWTMAKLFGDYVFRLLQSMPESERDKFASLLSASRTPLMEPRLHSNTSFGWSRYPGYISDARRRPSCPSRPSGVRGRCRRRRRTMAPGQRQALRRQAQTRLPLPRLPTMPRLRQGRIKFARSRPQRLYRLCRMAPTPRCSACSELS